MKTVLKKIRKNSERGQAIILIAVALVGIVAIVGLMIDGGILLIEYARLKRGIDAASIAAASQFRKGFVGADLEKAGEEFLKLNQSDADVTIYTCDYPNTNWDELLCPENTNGVARKLVKVVAREYVRFGFMRVVGMNGTWITATSVGEAAALDMVLVIDTSTSMAYETTGGDDMDSANPATGSPGDNPEECNAQMNDPARRCEPLGQVIDAAVAFVEELFFPYDRVGLVASTGQDLGNAAREPVTMLTFSDDENEVKTALRDLKVYQPKRCTSWPYVYDPNDPYPCLNFAGDDNSNGVVDIPAEIYYRQQVCIPYLFDLDPVTCGPSNIGGGLYEAGYQYADARQDSFWVVIALFGGPANASNPTGQPDGLCPPSTWGLPGGAGYCRDEDDMSSIGWTPPGTWSPTAATAAQNFDWSGYDPNNATRHHFTIDTSTDPDSYVFPADYDADDYARDGADYVTAPSPKGQGATLFSICMGKYCKAYPNRNDPASGELLGRYMAYHAGDDPTAIPPVTANHGLYFFAQDASVVDDVFGEIAKNILTRLSK
ncbi:hypothetical protein ANAEL_04349 [Anaerolineales bacterium]|nr:hypothetical protein ANAEL_04349 [Anaerolineales bacterium]